MPTKATKATKQKKEKEEAEPTAAAEPYSIQPTAEVPALDTSEWPLLLKNFERLLVRTGQYTPIPSGSSPLKRPIKEYLKSVYFFYIF